MSVGIFLAPRYILNHTFTHPGGVTGNVLCRLLTGGYWGWFGASASVFCLVVLAFERYYAVVHPHGNRERLSKRKLKVCEALCVTLYNNRKVASLLFWAKSSMTNFGSQFFRA